MNDHIAASATYKVTAPEQFNFSCPEEWARQFEVPKSLKEKDKEVQVNTLIYTTGAMPMISSTHFDYLHAADCKKYDTVKAKFDTHFMKR